MKKLIVVLSMLAAGVASAMPLGRIGPISDSDLAEVTEQIESTKKGDFGLFFKSPGGYVSSMWAFIRTMEEAKARGVRFICLVEEAYSAAVAIYSVCDIRGARPRATLMLHPASAPVRGNHRELREIADQLEVMSDAYLRQIGRVLNIPFAVLKLRAGNTEYWLDAGRAKAIGLVQEILP
jgi:ATP-dependent protease ClpP protease subunit